MATSRTRHSNPDKPPTCSDVQITGPAGRPPSGCHRLHTHRMRPKAFRYQAQQRTARSATYWRRRFVALVVGFGILSLVAWAFSGALAVGKTATSPLAGTKPDSLAQPAKSARPGNGAGSGASAGHAKPGASSSPSASASNRHRRSPAKIPAVARSRPRSRAKAAKTVRAGRARPCSRGDVVLSLFSSQDSYGPGQIPAFDVDVVSTSERTCTFNVGPKYLALVITSSGGRVWSSADCVAGQGSLLTDLVRGVPAVLPISWGRETSAPGCAMRSRRVPGGTYAAVASDGQLASATEEFRIS
jgi:hypothetical protein